MSAHQTGVVVPFGSGGFSPARGRPGARACSCWRGLGAPEPVRNLSTSQSKLLKWFGTAWPGERFTYHIGNLAADPLGTMDTFVTYGAPANLIETVNTVGLPIYARQLARQDGSAIDVKTEASILPVNKRPRLAVKIHTSN